MSQQIASKATEAARPQWDGERLKVLAGLGLIGLGGAGTLAWSGFLLWKLVEGIGLLF
jgi:hypothetical protein